MEAASLAMATPMDVQTTESGSRCPLLVEGETIAVSGMWMSPGKDAVPIHFIRHAENEGFRVVFGPGQVDVENEAPVRGAGFQIWTLLDTGTSYGLGLGFHHSNTTTEMIKTHWLMPMGCGVWRSSDNYNAFVLHNVYMHSNVPTSLTENLQQYKSIQEFQDHTGIEFDNEKAKIVMKWFAPEKKVAYVCLQNNESVQYAGAGTSTPSVANGCWDYYTDLDGKEFLLTWFHYLGERNSEGRPAAEPTVLQKVSEASSVVEHVPVYRAVGTLAKGVEHAMVEKFVGAAAIRMKNWHVFVQVV